MRAMASWTLNRSSTCSTIFAGVLQCIFKYIRSGHGRTKADNNIQFMKTYLNALWAPRCFRKTPVEVDSLLNNVTPRSDIRRDSSRASTMKMPEGNNKTEMRVMEWGSQRVRVQNHGGWCGDHRGWCGDHRGWRRKVVDWPGIYPGGFYTTIKFTENDSSADNRSCVYRLQLSVSFCFYSRDLNAYTSRPTKISKRQDKLSQIYEAMYWCQLFGFHANVT